MCHRGRDGEAVEAQGPDGDLLCLGRSGHEEAAPRRGRSYQGNVSELITQIAHQAARQDAAAELLRSHGRPPMTEQRCAEFEAEIAAELAAQRPKKRRGHAA